jgi:hypothetical protein
MIKMLRMKERNIRLRIRLYSAVLTLIIVGGFFLTYIFAQDEPATSPVMDSKELMDNARTVNYPLPYIQTGNRFVRNEHPIPVAPDFPKRHKVYSNKGVKLYMYTYPNPVTDYLILQVLNQELASLRYLFYDGKGVLLGGQRIVSDETNIRMDGLTPGVYILKVLEDNAELETFRIIKTRQ